MIRRLREPDHMILFLNLLLLMSIAILPFATSLMAAYLRESSGQHLAAAIYSGSLLLMAVCFAALNRHILLVKPNRLREPLSAARRRQILVRSVSGLVPYAIATALAVVSSYVDARDLRRPGSVLRTPDQQRRLRTGGIGARAQRASRNSAHDRHHAPSTRRQLSHATAATSASLKPASPSASSTFGVPVTSPSGAGIVAPS